MATTQKTTKKKTGAARKTVALEFNHAVIYTKKLQRSVEFHRDRLGFELIDTYPGARARLKSRGGGTNIALHLLDSGQTMDARNEGLRLCFEVKELDAFCRALDKKDVKFSQMPKEMPWGRKHAYLRDPDGHEISLYWAGRARLRKTTMRRSPS